MYVIIIIIIFNYYVQLYKELCIIIYIQNDRIIYVINIIIYIHKKLPTK